MHAVIAGGLILAQLSTLAVAEPLVVKIGYLGRAEKKATISLIEVPPDNDGVAGVRLALEDNNTTGKFLNQRFMLEEARIKKGDDPPAAVTQLADRGISLEHGRALDFGCGVGRLTRALAAHFDSCDGVDVAASMIDRARELNDNGERVRFHHNDTPDLRLFGDESFDFILALIVLQHMEPELMRGYMREFVRQ